MSTTVLFIIILITPPIAVLLALLIEKLRGRL
jgi:hypothetical protein